jgi:Putative transposase
MSFHPHLHCIVSTGGWDDKNQKWLTAKHIKHGFFLPQKVVAACFKKHFLSALSRIWEQGDLLLPKELMTLNNVNGFRQFYTQIAFKKNWVVKVMPPLDNPKRVIDYLGRYVYRIAITDNRIKEINIEDRKVVFEYKDYAAQTEGDTAPPMKTLTLDALEFIRRFAQHVLPQGFQKTRYYGIYATANHARLVSKILQSIGKAIWKTTLRTVCQIIMQATGQNPNLCPCCGAQELVIALIPPIKDPLTIEKTQDIIKIVRPPPQATKTDTF